MSSIDARLIAGLIASNNALSALLASLADDPVAPEVESPPAHPGMPAHLARSWKSYPGKGDAHHKRDDRWVDIRGAYATAENAQAADAFEQRLVNEGARAVEAAATHREWKKLAEHVNERVDRVSAVAQREREQIAESRRIESLYRAGHITQAEAIELAYHYIGKKRARAMMS